MDSSAAAFCVICHCLTSLSKQQTYIFLESPFAALHTCKIPSCNPLMSPINFCSRWVLSFLVLFICPNNDCMPILCFLSLFPHRCSPFHHFHLHMCFSHFSSLRSSLLSQVDLLPTLSVCADSSCISGLGPCSVAKSSPPRLAHYLLSVHKDFFPVFAKQTCSLSCLSSSKWVPQVK